MKSWLKLLIILPCALLTSSCFKKQAPVEASIIEVSEIAKEQAVPRAIMEQLESELKTESKSIAGMFFFTPLQVEFSEYSDGVLKSPLIRYNFPKGGGSIDLKEVVTGSGSFFMSFPPAQFEKQPELTHLYFISNSPITEIQHEYFGMGCGKWIDLKSNFSKLQKNDFLKLNTNELRYVFVMAGTYVFAFRQGTQVYLTQLTITDSRHTKVLCLGETPNDK